MALYQAEIKISKTEADLIDTYLRPHDLDHHQGEDNTIGHCVVFGNGFGAEVKCCGVQWEDVEPIDEHDYTNCSWTEIVLFEIIDGNWHEATCSPYVEDSYLGLWHIEYDGNEYEVNVVIDE